MRTFINITDGVKRVWDVERIWRIAAGLPVKEVPVESISNLDEVSWFGDGPHDAPTCRRVADHVRRIYEADFEHPVILSAEGWVMDGMHRVCKAYILGMPTVKAVQFDENPEPDEITA